ncbi:MAG TPA: hypothetical protein DCY64_22705 [Hydrogenophaga sp.]|uniref:hypothetical protein n=1 Tax=Hydrogenophaga sp. TaxID=1904254 RepID=UPI0008BF062A|nr:hypothetical protein [Hydrogenophaga sp.]OGA78796.1 MAG: hypothetical protein A2X73_07540 [Burkholderiales bacterium GWE1_65_30]OGA89368.1 MAG: hypothetical protein A2X72_16705 [Burkholderiales bacterium GWF1_66_17]HAX23083.1 hypothetical protein [Hydrogenophaga sp.]HBU17052.1 hypothetical protein [Hydrogenophaga sp.]
MSTNTDPAMKDVTEWINRSVGQHKRSINEGSASAARLIDKKAVSECGFGVCARDPDCFDHLCPAHPGLDAMVSLPVIDVPFLDSQLKCDLPIEMIEPVKSVVRQGSALKTAALVIAAMLALACTFYVSQ